MRLKPTIFFLILSCIVTYAMEYYSFTLAHSPAGLLAVFLCPGILVVVFHLIPSTFGMWLIAVLVNTVYYTVIWQALVRTSGKKTKPG
jgi:hypothetical protein